MSRGSRASPGNCGNEIFSYLNHSQAKQPQNLGSYNTCMVYSQAKQAGLHMQQYQSYARKIYGKLGKNIWRNISRKLGQRGCEQLRFLVLVCIKSLTRQYPKYLQVGVQFFIGISGKGLCQVFVGISLSKEVDMRSSMTLENHQVEQSLLGPLYRKFSHNYERSLYGVPSPNGQNLRNTHPSDIELKQSVATENLCIKWNVLGLSEQ